MGSGAAAAAVTCGYARTIERADVTTTPPPSAVTRWAVTGATGFIGSATLERLVAEPGTAVRGLVRRPPEWAMPMDGRREVSLTDLDDLPRVTEALRDCEVVLHCAFDARHLSVNPRHAEVLLHAARAAGVRRFVQVSSLAVHEPLRGDVLTEDGPVRGDSSRYAAAKLATDEVVTRLAGELQIELVLVRPTIVYGPGSMPWTIVPGRRLLLGGIVLPGHGEGVCNHVFVEDVVSGLIVAGTAPGAAGQTLLLSGPATATWASFYGALADELGAPERVLLEADSPQPARLHRLAQRALQVADRGLGRLGGPSSASARLRARLGGQLPHQPSGQERALYSASTTVSTDRARGLGYEALFDLADGMVATGAWARQHLLDS